MKPIIEPVASQRCRTILQEPARPEPPATPERRASRLILAIGMALCANSATVHAQSWEQVDDILSSARALAITTDSTGNVFVAGAMRDPANRPTAVVMKSSDGGQTWDNDPSTPDVEEPSDSISTTDGSLAEFRAISAARVVTGETTFEDHLVSVGKAKRVYAGPGGALTAPWLVRRSRDAGATWEMLDEYIHPAYNHLPTTTGPWGVALDSSGNIYVAGSAEEKIVTVKGKTTTTKIVNHWLIRKGLAAADGNMTWTTVGDFAYPVSNEWERVNIFPSGVACVGNNVFVVGGGGGSWQVRKSSDGGTTWPIVDSLRYDQSATSHAYGIAADSAGNVYVVGRGGRTAQNMDRPYWVVRKGTAAGTSWATVDQFQYLNGSAQAYGVTVDRDDDVHVIGTAWSSTSSRHWLTRQRSALNGSWSTTDDFTLAPNGNSQGKAIVADPFGKLFAAGSAYDSAEVYHAWLVRRKQAP